MLQVVLLVVVGIFVAYALPAVVAIAYNDGLWVILSNADVRYLLRVLTYDEVLICAHVQWVLVKRSTSSLDVHVAWHQKSPALADLHLFFRLFLDFLR